MKPSLTTAEAFRRHFDVSRETMEALTLYLDLLKQWNRHARLVAKTDPAILWHRHVADSAQLIGIAKTWFPTARHWLDIGSGGGFPGLVVAIMQPALSMTLIEPNHRKAAFLLRVVSQLNLTVDVVSTRIENWQIPPQKHPDLITARAVTPLPRFLDTLSSTQLTAPLLLLKGATLKEELTRTLRSWNIETRQAQSLTEPTATILAITAYQPKTAEAATPIPHHS